MTRARSSSPVIASMPVTLFRVLLVAVLLIVAAPLAPSAVAQEAGFSCASDAGSLSWTDDGVAKYWVYRSNDGGASYQWIGRTVGSPAPTTFDDPRPTAGARYQVHYQGIPRVDCTIIAEPAAREPFTCAADRGTVSWTDDGVAKYWVYRSINNGSSYEWLGRTVGSPAPTSITDPNPIDGALYQVHYQGIPRVDCTTVTPPPVEPPVVEPPVVEPVRPTAIVTMGDSYISGEAGRWAGNSNSSSADRDGTDRATTLRNGTWVTNVGGVYIDGTGASGCHRSDVSDALGTTVPVDARINIACSGAQAADVLSAASGGRSHKGEAPQVDQLASLADTHDIEMIVLSIGGNDLGFADIITDCAVGYSTSPSWWPNTCYRDQQSNVDARMNGAMAQVGAVIDDIDAVMSASGNDDYRLVLRSYPSPIPRGDEIRYSQSGWDRVSVGGCPFWNVDADWARDSLVPQISSNLETVAASRNVEFLDVSDMLQGREVCSTSAALGSGADAEWARFVTTGLGQGETQESMHPNAFGQQAAARCIDLVWSASQGQHRCTNTPGDGPDAMRLG